MLGENKLVLNHQQMCAALNYWLKEALLRGAHAVSTQVIDVSYRPASDTFVVTLEGTAKLPHATPEKPGEGGE